MRTIFKAFILFLKHPKMLKSDALSFNKAISFIIKSIGVYVVFSLIYTIVLATLYFWIDLKIDDFSSNSSDILKIIFIAPIIEELIFRLPLKNFFKNSFLSLALLSYFLVKDFIPIPLAVLLGLIVALLPYVTQFSKAAEEKVNSFVTKNYAYLFYFLAFSFGLLHVKNAEILTSDMYLSAFLYVIHPLFSGLFFAFIRVKLKYGIIYSIVIHALTNLFHILPAIL